MLFNRWVSLVPFTLEGDSCLSGAPKQPPVMMVLRQREIRHIKQVPNTSFPTHTLPMAVPSSDYDYVTFQLFQPATALGTKAKGAMLPQNLTCPICSARYMRPTHLHKHIRSHTYERVHKCIQCGSQFSRCDVLKRHMKTCKGLLNQHSRTRRSCEACVLSRTKCDRQLEQPCSGCVAQRRECVFIGKQPRRHYEGEITDTSGGSHTLSASCTPPSPFSSLPATIITAESKTLHPPPMPLDRWAVNEVSQTVSPQIERGSNQRRWEKCFDGLYPIDDWLDLHEPLIDGLDFLRFDTSSNEVPSYDHSYYPSPLMGIFASASEDEYIRYFFSDFCKHFPLVHPATWSTDRKPSVLIRAMQACGALFVKTRQATTFIEETLSSRNLLMREFAAKPIIDQDLFILTAVLLQTVGLFHPDAEQRVITSVYHEMLVTMIRQASSVTRLRSWMVPDLNDTLSLEQSWREWAMHETMKRVLALSYFHDCCYPIYFSKSPSFKSAEFDINLPSDDDLWNASDPIEWLELTRRPSRFSTDTTRLSGVNLHQALAALAGESEPLLPHLGYVFSPTPPNPFSHFIQIHAILRDIYSLSTSNRDYLRLQSILHNWLRTWTHCCDIVGPGYNKSSLVYNALQFYWLAQISLYAIEKGGSGWLDETARTGCRFALLREWLGRIRVFLRHNHEIPARLWGELMFIGSAGGQVSVHAPGSGRL
ncbi:uncharacterized protein BT62DRAFT_1077724 [Guyanagaster necrorhizus]|uniref:Uncharacterized protein n=1 Tax=Guyanagaster necrorhizus TaxID=856835 RepID=A0A9P7VPA6_9AGAR|nr:uncharacterized protein BT62DRAFT_1077724 [Guyanagaster necrorhizus MCA 3950]KAG7444384.1 hypothetical protein BT62DRAFT_1077724 [Guyanagaster necrorhizus MCA 3950]